MNKNNLIRLKVGAVALGIALSTTACSNNKYKLSEIPNRYNNIEDYTKYTYNEDGSVSELYKSENVYLTYNKDTYDVEEYIYYYDLILGGLGSHVELYDLETEEELLFCDGVSIAYNESWYENMVKNTYQICLEDAGDYVSDFEGKDYYTLDEIKALEEPIKEGLQAINKVKEKSK